MKIGYDLAKKIEVRSSAQIAELGRIRFSMTALSGNQIQRLLEICDRVGFIEKRLQALMCSSSEIGREVAQTRDAPGELGCRRKESQGARQDLGWLEIQVGRSPPRKRSADAMDGDLQGEAH